MAEELIGGRQCTLEGYIQRGRVTVYGVVDSIRDRNRSTFIRYQYPSLLPRGVQERMIRIAHRLLPAVVRWLAEDRVELAGGRVRVRGMPPAAGPLIVPTPEEG